MFNNIGKKMKMFAKLLTWTITVLSVFAWIVTVASFGPKFIVPGISIVIIGFFVSWLLSLGIYGFGQIIENTDTLVALQQQALSKKNATQMVSSSSKQTFDLENIPQ